MGKRRAERQRRLAAALQARQALLHDSHNALVGATTGGRPAKVPPGLEPYMAQVAAVVLRPDAFRDGTTPRLPPAGSVGGSAAGSGGAAQRTPASSGGGAKPASAAAAAAPGAAAGNGLPPRLAASAASADGGAAKKAVKKKKKKGGRKRGEEVLSNWDALSRAAASNPLLALELTTFKQQDRVFEIAAREFIVSKQKPTD